MFIQPETAEFGCSRGAYSVNSLKFKNVMLQASSCLSIREQLRENIRGGRLVQRNEQRAIVRTEARRWKQMTASPSAGLQMSFCKGWSILTRVYARERVTEAGCRITDLEQGRSWTVEWRDLLLFHSLTHLLYNYWGLQWIIVDWIRWPLGPKQENNFPHWTFCS